jgi:HSP20 family protein
LDNEERGENKMATETVPVKQSPSIFDELEKVQKRVMDRAYEIFAGTGQVLGRDFDHWLQAEREILWKPQIELSEKDGEFNISIAVPGVEARDLNIEVTPEELLVKGEIKHEHKEEKGTVHTCELETGSLFRSVRFPKKINPEKVKAEFKNGMLSLKASIAEEQKAKRIAVEAA